MSLFDIGLSVCLVMSRKVIRPTRFFCSSITGSFSILCRCRISSASAKEVFLVTVIKFSLVITSVIGRSLFFSNRKSLLVTIPANLPEPSTMGIPPILNWRIFSLASCTRLSKGSVTGSMIMPDSALFTALTLRACSSIVMFLCNTPIPPSRAMAIAIWLSVTVSIAAEIIGVFSDIFLENFD